MLADKTNVALRVSSTVAAKALAELSKHDRKAARRILAEAEQHVQRIKGAAQ